MAENLFADLDHDRARRTGLAEVIFCQGKTAEQTVEIVRRMLEREGRVLATRAAPEIARAVQQAFPDARYHAEARIISVGAQSPAKEDPPYVVVATAGTSDIPVAEEAALTLEFMGRNVRRVYDVGVAGIHRLLSRADVLQRAHVVIAVAGMEGALPSVIGGLVACPVIAVPTSIGYGASFNGLAALLAMLNSCAPGVAVVNIDNGFGAAALALKIMNGGCA
jgi:pyridinium-3,5-biscarboxylic acid mononucleotide synthase